MTPESAIIIAVGLSLAGPVLVAWGGSRLGPRTAWLALSVALTVFAAMAWLAWTHEGPGRRVVWPWVPSLGLNLAFLIDGVSLFFGLIVSGMGVLVIWYARYYLGDEGRDPARLYSGLVGFMAAMLGTVLADDLLLLFIFWELTGITSFLLIGFHHEEEGSRRGARMALLVTGATGLAALAGIVLLRQVAGTSSLRELMTQGVPLEAPETGVALGLLLLGAFGKSAQFPFHFWLPNAMSAPTPVSAYLHSATMVKLGVFLTARLFPIFQAHPYWPPLVASVAFVTLLLGAGLALVSNELKAILAYSTVSQLGFLIGYYGLGPPGGVDYDYLHILNHVFYKGALFMVVGILYVATHRKDVREFGGLWGRMPALGLVTAIACAAMMGLPGTTGFLSKEIMFKEIFVSPRAHGTLGMLAVASVVTSSLVKVAFSVRIFRGVFLGRPAAGAPLEVHPPPRWMLLPPLILAMGSLVFGVAPEFLAGFMHHLQVPGLHTPDAPVLHLWHGWNREVLASLGVVAGGLLLMGVGFRTGWRWTAVPRVLRWDRAFDALVRGIGSGATAVTRGLGADSPNCWLPLAMAFVVGVLGVALGVGLSPGAIVSLLEECLRDHHWDGLRVLVAALIAFAAIGVAALRSWPAQLAALCVVGFLTTVFFALYRAPDLALTQVLVDTVSLVLIALLLARFPRTAARGEARREGRSRFGWKALLSVGFGLVMTLMGLWATWQPLPDRVGEWYAGASLPLAEGANAVNTILVDFRGFDTLGEIAVLVVAMLGCLGLLFRRRRVGGDDGRRRQEDRDRGGGGGTSVREAVTSPMFAAVAVGLWWVLNGLAVYLLWRGHNAPGGGFIAGLVSAISLIILSLALGWRSMERGRRWDPARVAGWGLLVAVLTGMLGIVAGRPFLQHFTAHLPLPGGATFPVGSVLVFDIGVYLVVVGIAAKMITALGRSCDRLGALGPGEAQVYASSVEEPIEPPETAASKDGNPGRPHAT